MSTNNRTPKFVYDISKQNQRTVESESRPWSFYGEPLNSIKLQNSKIDTSGCGGNVPFAILGGEVQSINILDSKIDTSGCGGHPHN